MRKVQGGCAQALESVTGQRRAFRIAVRSDRLKMVPAAGRTATAPKGYAAIVYSADQGREMRTGWKAAGGDAGGPFAFKCHPVGG